MSFFNSFVFAFFVLSVWDYFSPVDGNALLTPVSRGVIWTRRHHNPTNYNYMGVNCGGIARYRRNDGQCGLCGDAFDGPRRHEFGGKFATGVIGKTYQPGVRKMGVKILINNDQGGYFEFRLCKVDGKRETQACFDKHLLSIVEAPGQGHGQISRYHVDRAGIVHLTLDIPAGLTCNQCILQWQYTTDNMWGRDSHGRGCLGCGFQETYVNCADVRIKGWNVTSTIPTIPTILTQPATPAPPPPVPTTPPPVPTTIAPTTPSPTTTFPTTPTPKLTQPVTKLAPETTAFSGSTVTRVSDGTKKPLISPSWTQSGNRINFVPQTPLDLHNMNEKAAAKPQQTPAPKRDTPPPRRGPPPRPPPSGIPRPPQLNSDHIAALNSNAKLHIHNSANRSPYIHLHSEFNQGSHVHNTRRATTMPPTRPAPVTTHIRSQTVSGGFNRNTASVRQGPARTSISAGWNKPIGAGTPKPIGVMQEYGITEIPKATFRPIPIDESRKPILQARPIPQATGRTSFNQRHSPDKPNQQSGAVPLQPNPPATTQAPGRRHFNPFHQTRTPVKRPFSRYDQSHFSPVNPPPSSGVAKAPATSRRNPGFANLHRPGPHGNLNLDPMGEPITTTTTTTVPTTPFSRFNNAQAVPARGKELKTLYDLRNRLRADSDMNKFRKPVVFERFTQFRVGKGKGPKGPMPSKIGSSSHSPSNDLVKPSRQPAFEQPQTRGSVSSNINNPHISSMASQNGPSSSRNIHGVDFLSQKPLRNEFKHTKHTNTLDKSHLPTEVHSQGQSHIPIAVVVSGHEAGGHAPGHAQMNGVLGIFSHNDTSHHRGRQHHNSFRVVQTTLAPFYRNQRARSFLHGMPVNQQLQLQTGQGRLGEKNVVLSDLDPSAYASGNTGQSNRRLPMSETDIQRQAGQVYDKTVPPVPFQHFGNVPGNTAQQFGLSAETQPAPVGTSNSRIESLRAGMLASIDRANNQNVDPSSLHAIQQQLLSQGIITDHSVPNTHNPPQTNQQVHQNVAPDNAGLPNTMTGFNQQVQMPFGQRGLGAHNLYPNQGNSNRFPDQGAVNAVPNQGLQNLFHNPVAQGIVPDQGQLFNPNQGAHNLFGNQENQHMYPNQAVLAFLQNQALQGMLPNQGISNNNGAGVNTPTTQAITTPMPKPVQPLANQHGSVNQAKLHSDAGFNIETASARELLLELRKFQEILKTGPLSQSQLQQKQILQVQLLQKLHEEQLKRADPNNNADSVEPPASTTTSTTSTTTTTTPTTTTPTTTTPTTTTPTTTTPTTTRTTTKPTTTIPPTTTVDFHKKLLQEQQNQIQLLMLQQQRLQQQLEQQKLEQQKQQQLEQQRLLELQQQKLEQQKLLQLEQQKQIEMERQKHAQLESQRLELEQKRLEQEKQQQLAEQRKLQLEKEKQLQLELRKQEEIKKQQLEKLRRLEQEQAQRQLEQELLLQKQHQQKQQLQNQLELQLQKQQPLDIHQTSDQLPFTHDRPVDMLQITSQQDLHVKQGPSTVQEIIEPAAVTPTTRVREQTTTKRPVRPAKVAIHDTVTAKYVPYSPPPAKTTQTHVKPAPVNQDTNVRLKAIVDILAKKMNIDVDGTGKGGKVPMLNGRPVSRTAIMKVLHEMAIDIMKKTDQKQKGNGLTPRPPTMVKQFEVTNSVHADPVSSAAARLVDAVYNPSTKAPPRHEITNEPVSRFDLMQPTPPLISHGGPVANTINPNHGLDALHHGLPHQLGANHFAEQGIDMPAQSPNHHINGFPPNQHNQQNQYPEMLHDLQTIANMMPDLIAHRTATESFFNHGPRKTSRFRQPTTIQRYSTLHTVTPPTVFPMRQMADENIYNIQAFVGGDAGLPNPNGLIEINPLKDKHVAHSTRQPTQAPPNPGTPNRRLTKQDISDLGNEILKQMKLLLARQRG